MEFSQAFFLYIASVKVCDALTVWGVWYTCWHLRFHTALVPIRKGIPVYADYSAHSLILMFVFSVVFHLVGAYRRDRVHFGFRSIKKLIEGSTVGTLVFIATLYFLGDVNISRIFLLIFVLLLLPSLILERLVLHQVRKLIESRLVRKTRILLVGCGELMEMYVSHIRRRAPYPAEWVGRLGMKRLDPPENDPLADIPYLGQEDRFRQVLGSVHVDSVLISYPPGGPSHYQEILEVATNELVGVKVLPDFGRYNTFNYNADQEFGIPFLQFNATGVGSSDRVLKRVFDIVISLSVLVIFSPLYLLIAALVKWTSKGPVFYSQTRIGADGTTFTLYKFRSMITDAEAKSGAVWATRDDARTTAIGKWLRRTSLDEIPQFYNVLRGDMSLVGPRPERPVFVEQFRKEVPKYMLRHKMKSGITGWAQVNGWRGNTSIEERIKHDLYYIGHWSHLLDLKILCLTLIRGFIHRHAY